ncbi:hypothetical protein BV898_16853 [Hypsibius exemplaris]|uniref:LysM domain-containing protein n=1 Tax=Hypsibius exemplaris TaxID=2072580 RepID=A0A9X6NEA0_HYPEX|nr:hypothetical protein BV898_16853 [Hypsibius exemplaris]
MRALFLQSVRGTLNSRNVCRASPRKRRLDTSSSSAPVFEEEIMECFRLKRKRARSRVTVIQTNANANHIGNIARRQGKSYGTTTRSLDETTMYLTHQICSSDTLQGIALKYGVTMEHLRRVNKLWASDTMHLRKILLIPIPAPIDGSSRNRTPENGHSAAGSPEPGGGFRNSNYPAGSRENPLSKTEALLLLKNYETDLRDQKPGTPESSSSSTDAVAPVERTVSPLDYFSRMDQNIASCRKNTEVTASNWSSRSYSVDQPEPPTPNGVVKTITTNGHGVDRSPSWGRVVKASKAHPELQLEGVDNMVFEL